MDIGYRHPRTRHGIFPLSYEMNRYEMTRKTLLPTLNIRNLKSLEKRLGRWLKTCVIYAGTDPISKHIISVIAYEPEIPLTSEANTGSGTEA